MTLNDEARAYIRKARRALAAARLLLREDDSEGACNRAYYAMFYAAQVVLVSIAGLSGTMPKTHRGLIAAFGQHVVLAGHMDAEFGRTLNEVQRIRELADYLGDAPSLREAATALHLADAFVQAVEATLKGAP